MKTKLFTLVMACIFAVTSLAQSLSGRVLDATRHPIAYATVVVYNQPWK